MTAEDIIIDLYQSKQLNAYLKTIVPYSDRQDFKQDLFIHLLQNKQTEVLWHFENGSLKFLVMRIARQRWIDVLRSRRPTDQVPDIAEDTIDISERRLKEQMEDYIIREIENFDQRFNTPYYRLLLQGLKRYGSLRELSRQTGINVSVLSRSMAHIRAQLRLTE